MSSNIFCIFLFITLCKWSEQIDPFCQPLIPNIDPSNLPKLPQEFQTRIEINVLHENKSEELFVKFDYYDKKGEIIKRTRDKKSRTIYFFDKNELFYLEDKRCSATRLNESSQNIYFGLIWDGNTYNMQQSNYFFHFNNGYPTVKLDDTKLRDISVSHFQSCQNWQEVNGNVLIDFYFSKPSHTYPINYDTSFKELPISIKIEGYINMNQPQETKIKMEYNFFEFRTAIERKFDLFTLPKEVYCDGQIYKEELPKIPDTFSFSEDIISQQYNFEKSSNVYYSKPLKAVRYDFEGNNKIASWFIEGFYKAIHDFTSGVGYVINQDNQNCLIYPIGTLPIDRNDIFPVEQGNQALIQLKEPNQFFYLDDSYFYAGQRYERDILCDVFISKRTDIMVQNKTGIPVIVEFYFQNVIANYDQGFDQIEEVVPISIHVNIESDGIKVINQIFNFDSASYNRRFDISECFYGKDKILFSITFKIPDDISFNEFGDNFSRPALEKFEETLIKSLNGLEYSPLRIVSPRIKVKKSSFAINSGVTASAQAINHFRKIENSRIDQTKVRYKSLVDSPAKCASVCLDKYEIRNLTGNRDFTCRSFDYCPTSTSNIFLCSFYDLTISDPDLTLESAPACEHYSKSTKDFDIATVDQMYGSIKQAVLKKEFKFLIETNQKKVYNFEAEDIFDQNNGQMTSTTGSTSYFSRFSLFFTETDFQESYFNSSPKIFWRNKLMISIDECSRLCIYEPAFDCHTFTFNSETKECKWSNLVILDKNATIPESIKPENGSSLFSKNPLYDYIELPFKVTSLVDYTLSDVSGPNECAYKCNTKKNCRSFNLCQKDDETFRCLLSDTNVHSTDKDPNNVYSAICSHYSIRSIKDFEEVVKTELSVQPQSSVANQSVEGCAEICSFQDSYLCRSFDYNVEEKTCKFYKENLIDKKYLNLGIKQNAIVNHYSRLYYQKDGKLMKIGPLIERSKKFSGGAIFGVTLAVIIAGLIIGGLIGLAYTKFNKKTSNFLPVMRFINPNYEK